MPGALRVTLGNTNAHRQLCKLFLSVASHVGNRTVHEEDHPIKAKHFGSTNGEELVSEPTSTWNAAACTAPSPTYQHGPFCGKAAREEQVAIKGSYVNDRVMTSGGTVTRGPCRELSNYLV